jgi:hypothetical protein
MGFPPSLTLGKLDWSNWIYNLVWAFIGGGANAVTSGVVVSSFDPEHFNLHASAFYILVSAVFTVNGTLKFFATLAQQPLPKIETTTTTSVETTQKKPEATVVTKTETVEKKVDTSIKPEG